MSPDSLFEVHEYPDDELQAQYDELVGLDKIKEHLDREASLMLSPDSASEWSQKQYHKDIPLLKVLSRRPPLFLFAGDVGTGKTALAESFPDKIARAFGLTIYLYKLSLNVRGAGAVGQMTSLLGEAFKIVREEAEKRQDGKSAVILLIDEADALAQSRETDQMHHEDRAGVNALIRGIDSITKSLTPVLVIMSTNRPASIDPAIRRRSASSFDFTRPNTEDMVKLLTAYLNGTDVSTEQISELATLCVPYSGLGYGYTYSDITQKILPAVLLRAMPDAKVTFDNIKAIIEATPPTAPFNEL